MPKQELIEFHGTVIDTLPDGGFRVRLDNGHEILADTSGRMKQARIRVMRGDRITLEMTSYDLSKGRITFREKGAQVSTTRPSRRSPLRMGGDISERVIENAVAIWPGSFAIS